MEGFPLPLLVLIFLYAAAFWTWWFKCEPWKGGGLTRTGERLDRLESLVDVRWDCYIRGRRSLNNIIMELTDPEFIRNLAREEAFKAITEVLEGPPPLVGPFTRLEADELPENGNLRVGLQEWLEERLGESMGLYRDLKKSGSPHAEYWNGNSMALSGILGWLKHA